MRIFYSNFELFGLIILFLYIKIVLDGNKKCRPTSGMSNSSGIFQYFLKKYFVKAPTFFCFKWKISVS